MEIVFKNIQKEKYLSFYNQYINEYRVPFSYHPYITKYHKLIARPHIDESFVVIENGKCVGICYCPLYETNGRYHISNNNGYTLAPLAVNKRIYKEIFKTIDEIAIKHHCLYIKFYIDSNNLISKENLSNGILYLNNHILLLKEYGFIDTSSIDTVVNLSLSESQLWTNLTKKYKNYINQMKKDASFDIKIINHKNSSKELHDLYVHFHHLCSRRKTRSDASFEIQYQMLLDGHATLFCLFYKQEPVSFYYCFHFNNFATAGSASDNPLYEQKSLPIYHYLTWNSIIYLKNQKNLLLSIGQPSNFHTIQGFEDYCDNKQINIAIYKRRMGGQAIPLIRGIKYFDKESFLKHIEKFKEEANNDT